MTKTIAESVVDLTSCDREAIHIPNLIQPHGALLVIGTATSTLIQASANLAELVGLPPENVLGRSLADVLGPDAAWLLQEVIKTRLSSDRMIDGPRVFATRTHLVFETTLHLNAIGIVVELIHAHSSQAFPLAQLNDAINRIKHTFSVEEFCQRAVDQVREFTQFDRVMVYRFLEDDTGIVVAESVRSDLGSYRGHHYPASDIPRQARELYCRNWVRIIADVDAVSIPIVSLGNRAPLDMTHCLLRHVSSIHLEYLRNMGVRASTSLSIMDGNRLWGLIACHHLSPRFLPADVRTACELIAHVLSIQMAYKERQETRHQRARLKNVQESLREALAEDTLLEPEQLASNIDLLRLMESDGFALHMGKGWESIGRSPSIATLDKLVSWLEKFPEDLVSFESWPEDCPIPEEEKKLFSGLMAVRLSRQEKGYALWFRPEWVRTIPWAGNPNKPVQATANGDRLNPRTSFELWTEEVRGRSRPWPLHEKVWAGELRRSLIEIILRRNERRLARLNEDLEKEITLRSEELRRKDQALHQASKLEAIGRVSGGIAHDFNNLLTGISGMIESVKDSLPSEDSRRPEIDEVLHACDRAFALTKQLLAFGRRQPGDSTVLILNDAIRGLSMLLQNLLGSEILLVFDLQETPKILLDRTHLEQILLNLVVNARDAMPKGGKITLRTKLHRATTTAASRVLLEVEDTGTGMTPEVQSHIFEPFYSTKSTEQGTGLGLATVYGIVKQSNGDINVSSQPGYGTVFRIAFPCATP